MAYTPSPTRYDKMIYNRCGRSGLKLPAISLGLWHNFGFGQRQSARQLCRSPPMNLRKSTAMPSKGASTYGASPPSSTPEAAAMSCRPTRRAR